MALKSRGGDTPNTPDLGGDAARAFGVEDIEPGTTPEEAVEKLRAIGGDGAVQAARLSVAAVAAYDYLEDHPGDEEGLRALYQCIDELAKLPGANLRTVLVTGIVAIHTLRKQNGK